MSGGDSGRRVIDGRFALEARLGGGGMGLVWRARDLVLDRAVALKEVRPADPGLAEYDPEAARTLRARVLREARALARVDHPNVVTIHHVVDGGEDTYPWLVMELVTGGSLHERLARGPMDPAEAARLGRELLSALRAAHDAGIQHRDVKPANVLLRPDGRPVLTDFGIAAIRESTALTATGSIIGTPDYMAPERISGESGGPASDLWSLAMMLYVAVEGSHPLRRATTLATLAAVLNEELPPPLRAGPLAAVLNASLAKDPAARPDPQTMDRMLAAAAGQGPPAAASEATSYHLTPPRVPPAGPPLDAPPAGPPRGPDSRTTAPVAAGSAPGRRPGRRRPAAIGSAVLGVALTGVLIWAVLPDKNDSGLPSGAADRTASRTPGSSGPQPDAEPAADDKARETDDTAEEAGEDLLTPAGIRMAVRELKAEMGTGRVGRFVVYPEYVSADAMVKGSDKKYDSYTYRVGQGVSRGPISGTLAGGRLPVNIDSFDWDLLPALMTRAAKDLKVKDPTSRYLVIRQPNDIFGTEAGFAVYFSDEYGGGYLEADLQGKVTRVTPADS